MDNYCVADIWLLLTAATWYRSQHLIFFALRTRSTLHSALHYTLHYITQYSTMQNSFLTYYTHLHQLPLINYHSPTGAAGDPGGGHQQPGDCAALSAVLSLHLGLIFEGE